VLAKKADDATEAAAPTAEAETTTDPAE